jgi:hypothetical protein
MAAAPSKRTLSSAASSTTTTKTGEGGVQVLTITVAALPTTFTPPSECDRHHLTLLPSPVNQIWVNEPQPVAGTKIGDCYPEDFADGYTSLEGSSSSIAPMFRPLVCPRGWETARTWESGYIACCLSYVSSLSPSTGVRTASLFWFWKGSKSDPQVFQGLLELPTIH